jgi:uncharacterized protein (DUF58 family)
MDSLALPPLSRTKDAYSHALLRTAGLAGAWNLFAQRISQPGRWVLLTTAAFFGYGTSSLELQAYVPLAYVTALWAIAFIALFFARPRVSLAARHADRVCAGETLPVDIEVQAARRCGHGDLIVIPHRLPQLVDAVPEAGVALPALDKGEKTRVQLGLRCKKRGVYRLRGYRAETDFPFGILVALRAFHLDRTVTVYPRFSRLNRLDIPSGRRYHPGGVALASIRGDSLEFMGNREYREGDNVRDIDWRATARLGLPIVREYREEFFHRVAVILDTHVPRSTPRERQERDDDFERAVSMCAAVGDYMAQQEYLVDIFAAGPNLYHLTAGRSLAYLDQILDILAAVESNPQEPFDVLEPEIFENLAQITTIICVFLDWTESRRAFVHRLSQQGAAIKVLIVRDAPCTLAPQDDHDLLGIPSVIDAAGYAAGIEEL